MNRSELARDIIATYKKHGWQPRQLLLRPESRSEVESNLGEPKLEIKESVFDAIWFSRPSLKDREAWEIRLLEENPYALFETFAADLPEEEREALRIEMEERIQERAKHTESN